jgi:hypothetical protein
MIPIFCKEKRKTRKLLGKKYKICEFVGDGVNYYPFIRHVNDLPILCIKVTFEDFEKSYINQLLISSGLQPLYSDLMNVKSEEDFTFMESMTELEALEFKLSIAEENQQFELAAELRDKIKKIKDNGGK